MNIKELAEQAGMHYRKMSDEFCEADKDGVPMEMLERFAELIRADERDKCAQDYLQDCSDAIDAARLEEREVCAKLCDEAYFYFIGDQASPSNAADYCAEAIRQRGDEK